MPRYLISFDDGAMDHIAPSDLPAVSDTTHAVVHEAKAAGVWIFGGGLPRQQATVVQGDGRTSPGPLPQDKAALGGFCILEVASHAEALDWAARFASACRCAQEVREIFFDPAS